MEELRTTADAYYKSCDEHHKQLVKQFFNEMDRDSDGKVCFEEFKSYMKKVNCPQFGTRVFFDELRGNKKELSYKDVVTLVYIIYSGRPFCEECKAFVKGIYFTCVRCFEAESGNSFNVCPSCFYARSHGHRHKEFMDPFMLLSLKRKQDQNTKPTLGHTKAQPTASNPGTSSSRSSQAKSSSSKTIVVAPNPQRETDSASSSSRSRNSEKISRSPSRAIVQHNGANLQTGIQFGQLMASFGSLFLASASCTIL